jgi:putative tricarboxylic transport membrane protein
VPGPAMLTTHLPLTFSFVWLIVISNIITVAICFLFLNQLVKITYVRSSLLIPGILLLVFLGGYSDSNSIMAMGITLLFGFVGLAMVHLDWPRPPLILGLVLGSLIEKNFFISYSLYGFGLFSRPTVIVILAFALLAVFFPVIRTIFVRRLGFRENVLVSEEA